VAISSATPMKGYKIAMVKMAVNEYWQKIDKDNLCIFVDGK